MKWDGLIFDIDGTLWDSTAVVADGWNKALHELKLNRKKITSDEVRAVCGLPYEDCVINTMRDYSLAEVQKFIPVFEKYERAEFSLQKGKLFDGVTEGLRELYKAAPLYVVSNCQDWYYESFMNQTGLRSIFRDGLCYGHTSKPKGENIRSVIMKHKLENSVYVGDTMGDQKAAEFAGTEFIFASYGFGKVTTPLHFNNFQKIVKFLLE